MNGNNNLNLETADGLVIRMGVVCEYHGKATEICIPEGVSRITSYVFCENRHLKRITLPSTLIKISAKQFMNCSELCKVTIPEGVTQIGEEAFEGCKKLTRIEVPGSVKKICNRAFAGCTSLTVVELTKGVTEIGSEAFNLCEKLLMVTLPDTVKIIHNGAFKACDKLTEICIPEGVEIIYQMTFTNCKNLRKITLPETLKKIGYSAFEYCGELREITLPGGLEHIDKNAFSECECLARLDIPEGCEVDSDALFGCTSLTDERGLLVVNGNLCAFDYNVTGNTLKVPDDVETISDRLINSKITNLITKLDSPIWYENGGYDHYNIFSYLSARPDEVATVTLTDECGNTVARVAVTKQTVLMSAAFRSKRDVTDVTFDFAGYDKYWEAIGTYESKAIIAAFRLCYPYFPTECEEYREKYRKILRKDGLTAAKKLAEYNFLEEFRFVISGEYLNIRELELLIEYTTKMNKTAFTLLVLEEINKRKGAVESGL